MRGFQSRAEHTAWAREVVRTRMLRPEGMGSVGSDAVPFLVDTSSGAFLIDHLKIEAMPAIPSILFSRELQAATPAAASIQATWPITSNSLVADQVSDFCQTDYKTSWARTFRLARFYEALDALTADVAYTYTDGLDKGLVLVTGGHYHSLKLRRTMPTADVTLRSYVTSAGGGASMEVRTDLVQTDPATGEEVLIQCCHTAMVALDKESRRPAKDAVPTLVIGDGDHLTGRWMQTCDPRLITRPDVFAYGRAIPEVAGWYDYRICYRQSATERLRTLQALLPVLRENQAELRAFGLQIVGRLAERQAARALGYVRDQVGVDRARSL